MTSANYGVRRATVDDLKGLITLWQGMGFPTNELEKRLTEFHVIESPDGRLLGALGLEIQGRQGRMHHEVFDDFALADQLRPLLWQRIQNVATNHGLFRLWTREHAPFWSHTGLQPASAAALQKLPAAWNKTQTDWLTLQLRDEAAIEAISLDKEFAMFMEAEKQRTAKVLQRARALKTAATLVAIILGIFVLFGVVYMLRHNPQLLNRSGN